MNGWPWSGASEREPSYGWFDAWFLPITCLVGGLAAGGAALGAPHPGRWTGLIGGGVCVWSILLLHRRRRSRRAITAGRFHDLETELGQARNNESLYAALLDSLPMGVVAVRSGHPVYANRAAVRFLGERIIHRGAPIPPIARQVMERAGSGHTSSGQFTQGFPRRVMEVRGYPPGPEGVSLLHLSDITERWQTDRMRHDFVVAASHELKTPVSAIKAAAETVLVAIEDDPEAVLEFSGRILSNATRMSHIVTDLLDLSRLESTTPEMEPFDLARPLREVARRFGSSLPPIALDASPTPIVGNPSDLALAFRNLLENAVRHTPETGRVEATVSSRNGEAVVTVSDTGAGIPAVDLPRIFERFYRADAARSRATGGTGLGLAIVKHVAEIHGGRVEVESRLGEGSTFRLFVPAAPESQLRTR